MESPAMKANLGKELRKILAQAVIVSYNLMNKRGEELIQGQTLRF